MKNNNEHKLLADNRKAFHDYEIIEKYKLTSNDVLFLCWFINFYNSGHAKSIRDGSDYYIWIYQIYNMPNPILALSNVYKCIKCI